ncbi:MAG: hypothetical protein EZS28_053794 [Streblomastix strix]|uniref:Uncharacterized protein n=1 Tax=Streblomastix strix TaxID=222440 RepID=A0A5J4R326_9EUKA|nr:MAG: hypothetical protein EZS28_053794 [Streblomastix strix]
MSMFAQFQQHCEEMFEVMLEEEMLMMQIV